MASAQVVICKCGSLFAAAVEPYCYSDVDWMRDLRRYVKEGCAVKLVDTSVVKTNLEKCKCVKESEHKNQLSLL